MFRGILLRLSFLKALVTYKEVDFRGWCVVFSFPRSAIKIGGGHFCVFQF